MHGVTDDRKRKVASRFRVMVRVGGLSRIWPETVRARVGVSVRAKVRVKIRGLRLGLDVGLEAEGGVGTPSIIYSLSWSIGQTNLSRNMADIQHIKCKNQRKASPHRQKFCTLTENRGRRIVGGVA